MGLVEESGDDLVAMGGQGFGLLWDGLIVEPGRDIIDVVLFGGGPPLLGSAEATQHNFMQGYYNRVIIKPQLSLK